MIKYTKVSLCTAICFLFTLSLSPSYAKTIDTDMAIIGCGGSGLTAGLTAAYGGAKVTILEKMPFAGGTSNFPEGIFAVESEMQRAINIGITKDEVFKIMMDYSHWRANAQLVRAIIDKSPDTIAWLQNMGVELIRPAAIFPKGPETWHLFKGMGPCDGKSDGCQSK